MYSMSKKIYYVADFFQKDEDFGGAAMSDNAFMERLRDNNDIVFEHISYKYLKPIEEDAFYIVANRSLFPRDYLKEMEKASYVIIEHDHQYDKGQPGTNGRNPYMYGPEGIVPDEFKWDLDFYRKADAVFLQTDFHKELCEKNNIEGNLISLKTTVFTKGELSLLRKVLNKDIPCVKEFGILESGVWLKGTANAVQTCQINKWEYQMIKPQPTRELFLEEIAKYATLVFIPLSPESCCRFVMEAKMLGLNIITTANYGAPLSEWFSLKGAELIDEIERLIIEESIPLIEKYLPC